MQNIKLLISISLIAMFLTSCMQTKFNLVKNKDNSVATYDRSVDYFISGLGQQKNIDPSSYCDEGEVVTRVETQTTFVNGLLAAVTFGIYTPQQVRVFCSKP